MRYGIWLLVLWHSLGVRAEVKLPALLSDGMVLQQQQPIRFWGWADPGETVRVDFAGNHYTGTAAGNGQWSITLSPQAAGGPWEIQVQGKNIITLRDVWVGEVWLCSGQSNMELDMRRLRFRYPEAIRGSANPMIRQFLVPDRYDFDRPQEDIPGGRWQSADPNQVLSFSGVAYFFAREIHARTGCAVGIINAALGGSPANAWISESALAPFPEDLRELQLYQNDTLIHAVEARNRRIQADWQDSLTARDEGLRQQWQLPQVSLASWTPVTLPSFPLRQRAGVVWYRRTFWIPAGFLRDSLLLELGRLVDADSVYVNGFRAGTTSYQYPPRRYVVPGRFFREGENEIVVRLVSIQDAGGFMPDRRYALCADQDAIPLSGTWYMQRGAVMVPMQEMTTVRWKPAGLFNAMIAPLTRFAIRGVLWYQGESNAAHPETYGKYMEALVRDWRSRWGLGDLPFLGVLLPGYGIPTVMPRDTATHLQLGKPGIRWAAQYDPAPSSWAELRQQQLSLLRLPHTGMANAIDLGEWNDIHPENKQELGYRLALLARKYCYGENDMTASGPVIKQAMRKGHTVIVSFAETGKGLVTRDFQLPRHFALAGQDGIYHWASARIQGDTIVLQAVEVPDPVSVRYAWADFPEGLNLYNREGLPAVPGSIAVRW